SFLCRSLHAGADDACEIIEGLDEFFLALGSIETRKSPLCLLALDLRDMTAATQAAVSLKEHLTFKLTQQCLEASAARGDGRQIRAPACHALACWMILDFLNGAHGKLSLGNSILVSCPCGAFCLAKLLTACAARGFFLSCFRDHPDLLARNRIDEHPMCAGVHADRLARNPHAFGHPAADDLSRLRGLQDHRIALIVHAVDRQSGV